MVRFMLSGRGARGLARMYGYASGFILRKRFAAGFALSQRYASGFTSRQRYAFGFTFKQRYAFGCTYRYGFAFGFTYIGLLMMIAISGIGLAALGQAWHTASQRDKEQDLLFVGMQISQAISRYHEATPSPIKQYPPTLAALLDDRRGPKPARHLRKIYIDPMTASRDWGLIKDANGITGVYSRSKLKPFKQESFSDDLQGFSGAGSYQDWHFVASDKGGPVSVSPRDTSPQTPTDPTAPAPQPTPTPAGAGGAGNPEKYAQCGSSLDAAQLSCHSGCGLATSPACRSCLQAAFDSYRQCLR